MTGDRLTRLEREVRLIARQIAGLPIRIAESGGGGGTSNIRFARVTTAFAAAAGPLEADWTDGEVKFQDDSTGELDDAATECKNSWIGTGWVEDAQVAVDTGYDPPRIVNGTCTAVDWGD